MAQRAKVAARRVETLRRRKRDEAMRILQAMGFGGRQSNELACHALLALLGLRPEQSWRDAGSPLRGITPIIKFVEDEYGVKYAPNTRETVRDEAVKYFVEAGIVVRNPDEPGRATNSGKTVYQVEPTALALIQSFGSPTWEARLESYLSSRGRIREELERSREMVRIPVTIGAGKQVALSPGGQNPLIKQVIEEFCPRFVPGGRVIYIGDAEDKFRHLDKAYLRNLGVELAAASKLPDVVVHDTRRGWLLLVEAVTSAGPVDGKRRKELKKLFQGFGEGLVFVTAFESRQSMRSFLSEIAWESEVWVAESPEHMIHFNGERFLGPYADVQEVAG